MKPAMVNRNKAVGHYAVSSLFQDYPERAEVFSYFVDRESYRVLNAGPARLAIGHCTIKSKITWQSSQLEFGVLHMGDHNVSGGVRGYNGQEAQAQMTEEMSRAFERADFPEVIRLIDKHFGKSVFSLRSLFRDEQRRVLDLILKATNADIEGLHRHAFEKTAPLMRFLVDLGLALPPVFRSDATAVLNSQLWHAFEESEPNADRVMGLLEQARFWQIEIDAAGLSFVLGETIEKLAEQTDSHPGDLAALRKLSSAVRLSLNLPFKIQYYRIQNIYYDTLKTKFPEVLISAKSGDSDAAAWAEEFRALGSMLSVKVE